MSQRSPIHVGVAGWDYPDWKGVVYPEPAPKGFDRVRYLAGFLDLIEINSTFYRPPAPHVAKRWAARVRDLPDFRYTAKLYRRFTHERKEAWSRQEAGEVHQGLGPLLDAGALEALLVQFPWSFKNEPASRDWLADVVGEFEGFPLVVEVRHASWNEPEFYGWLAEQGVGFVNIDQPLFHRSIKPSARSTGRVGYVRVHGRNYMDWFRKGAGRDARYDYLYEPSELEPWSKRTVEVAAEEGTDVVDVVFNNHYKGQAVVNAIQFKMLLGESDPAVPEPLREAYPDAFAD